VALKHHCLLARGCRVELLVLAVELRQVEDRSQEIELAGVIAARVVADVVPVRDAGGNSSSTHALIVG